MQEGYQVRRASYFLYIVIPPHIPRMSNQGCFDVDPDITGIGVRINLYTTALLIAAIPRIPATIPLLEVLLTNGTISGFALLVTAIIRTAQHKLTLYHAIFILHMLFFLGVGVFPTGRYRSTASRRILMIIVTISIVFLFDSWALYVWGTAPTFGPTDTVQCNAMIKYIFVFVPVRATVLWLRVLWMLTLGIGGFGTILYMFSFILALSWGHREFGNDLGVQEQVSSRIGIENIMLFISSVYAVVMLELYVHKNQHLEIVDEDDAWPFGQILALVMLVSTFNEIIHCLLGLRLSSNNTNLRSSPEVVGL